MNPELRRIAARVVWWNSPEQVLERPDDFICRVMALGDLTDANFVEGTFGQERLQAALRSAPPGVFDARSWHYWHHRLGMEAIGPLPVRRLP